MSEPVERDLGAEEDERLRRDGLAPRRRGQSSGSEDGTKRLVVTAGGLGAVLVAVVGGWTLLGHRPHGIPVIEPPPGPIRVRPVDPGGMQLSGVSVASNAGDGTQTLAPPPEQAHPERLRAELEAAQKERDAATATTGATNAAAGTEVPPSRSAATAPEPRSEPAPAAPTPAPATPSLPTTATPPATIAPPPPRATEREEPAGGGHGVQLAALDSEAAAKTEWARLSRSAPDLFARREPVIVPVEKDGKRFFRLRTGGFDSVAEATRFCGALRAKNIACTLADF
ncbi:MAG: SPOR domain-containing protein [Gluconacetobacter diazotrophicus]|nr:SPOR domain-containing protein [Gluconacetobacter diazotrophicus]